MLFLYCFAVRKNSSQVQVLWEDHRNDLFVNGFGMMDRMRQLVRFAYHPQVSSCLRVVADGPGVCPPPNAVRPLSDATL